LQRQRFVEERDGKCRLSGVRHAVEAPYDEVCRVIPYASNVRAGRRRPHQRHWLALARLVSVALPTDENLRSLPQLVTATMSTGVTAINERPRT
jgi:hypothetical protein